MHFRFLASLGMTSVKGTRTSDYEFELPAKLIAQEPLADRAASRLMVLHRDSERIEHRRFADIVDLIPPGDLLVVNTTRVLKARLLGRRASGAPAEILLLKPVKGSIWEAMVSPGGKLKPGRMVEIGEELSVEILEVTERRTRLVRLHTPLTHGDAIERYGHVPLPPYIQRPDTGADNERYQTVYAIERGSAAAPTAGLHFTTSVLESLEARGIRRASLMLHVGAGTFKPVETDDPADHVMHEERFAVPGPTADAVTSVKRSGGGVWAVGTTSVRTLESAADHSGTVRAGEGETRLFIRPPYQFRVVDHVLTNFHLPRSTLIMLVAAFAGYEFTMRAYREAIAGQYRFLSYGDAMVIV
ncbi:MAG: tRNA preQ1(34) S-adenosylmethionine ribosyltransferase-isomerase QueA [Gemmatimonadaceae bacterium]